MSKKFEVTLDKENIEAEFLIQLLGSNDSISVKELTNNVESKKDAGFDSFASLLEECVNDFMIAIGLCDEEPSNSNINIMNEFMKEKIDIVEKIGYTIAAKIVAFAHMGMTVYGIEVNKPVNGVTNLAEYSLKMAADGSRTVVQNGDGTLITPYPIFAKPVTENIVLHDYRYTGEVVSCQPGEDTIKGIAALVEMLKTKI